MTCHQLFKSILRPALLSAALLLHSFTFAQTSDETLAGAVLIQPKESAPPKIAPPISSTDESVQLSEEISDLKKLLEGLLPQNLSISALFEVDLQDEIAVKQRVEILTERLSAPSLIGTEVNTVNVANDIRYMRIERDKLRLAFLSLPLEQRNTLREQDRLKQRSKDLASEQKNSEAALASSEKARDTALSTANKATDEIVRTLATEEARLLAHLSELASLRQSWIVKNQALLEQHRKLLTRYINSIANQSIKPEDADVLYEKIRIDLRKERESASLALSAMSAPLSVLSLESSLDVTNPKYNEYADALTRIGQLRRRISIEEANLQLRESNERYAHADEIMRTLSTLQAKRVALLPLLTPEKRDQVTGLTKDGLDRIVSEMNHVQLMVRWYPIQRLHEAKNFAGLLNNVFEAGKFGAEILGFIVVLFVLLVGRRKGRIWLNRLRLWLPHHIHSVNLMRRFDSAMQMLIRISNELFILLSVYILFDQILQTRLGIPELAVLRSLVYAYAFYALAIAFIHRVLLVAVSRYRVVEFSLNEKILRSLRLIARVVLIFVMYLIIAKAMLGEGALYGINQKIAIMVALFLAWRLMRDWRFEVTQAYLSFSPTGRLADLVRGSQERSHGLLIAAAAFMYVAARGIWIWLRDAALSFEQTRKALAYLFRRQLERQSKNQVGDVTPTELPEALNTAFSEDAATDLLCIDYYPHLEEIVAKTDDLLQNQQGSFIALKGERGSGKTTWLTALQKRLNAQLPCTFYSLETRITNPNDACLLLSQILKVPESSNVDELIQSLLNQPAQAVLIDLGQNFMLRDVGGLAAYELVIKVAQATVSKILWVISFSRWAFEYLQRNFPGRDVFDQIIVLLPWSERRIAELLDARLTLSGFTADYDQIMLNAPPQTNITISKTSSSESMDEVDQIEKIADRYYRLIWDYADGNPRVALHFFRLSLSWTSGKKVSVRLFPLPSMNELETFEKRTHYLLACLVQHENISIQDAANSLRFPLHECARSMQLLEKEAYVTSNENGVYRVTSHWNRAVLRFLNRKKLLAI
jgi:energy-coupling factor transporter ATP-binding protein EcfA2